MKTNTEPIEESKVNKQTQWAKNYIAMVEKVSPNNRFEIDPMILQIYELAKAIVEDQLTSKEEQ